MSKKSQQVESLQKMTLQELNNELISVRKDQFKLRMKRASEALEKTHLIKEARKKVARIKTLITEKMNNVQGDRDGN